MKLIPLSKNSKKNAGKYFAQVDDKDYEWLSRYTWAVSKDGNTFYARRSLKVGQGKRRGVNMAREIMRVTDPKIQIDHRDHNGLNNQRENLRIATPSQNGANRRKRSGTLSKYLGVTRVVKEFKNHQKDGTGYWSKTYWTAQINPASQKSMIRIGLFPYTDEGEVEAAKAFDEAAKKYYGEFANLNFKV